MRWLVDVTNISNLFFTSFKMNWTQRHMHRYSCITRIISDTKIRSLILVIFRRWKFPTMWAYGDRTLTFNLIVVCCFFFASSAASVAHFSLVSACLPYVVALLFLFERRRRRWRAQATFYLIIYIWAEWDINALVRALRTFLHVQ